MQSSIRVIVRLAAAVTVFAVVFVSFVTPAQAAVRTESFDDASATVPPSGWTVANTNVAGMAAGWQGWTFHTTSEVVTRWGSNGNRGGFSRADGRFAVVHSDANRPTTGRFDSTLWSAPFALDASPDTVSVAFDSHYRQGQSPQVAQLVARFDGGQSRVVQSFTSDRLDERVEASTAIPEGAESVEFGWYYGQSSNNWYWMIDDVEIAQDSASPSTPTLVDGTKPVLVVGEPLALHLAGLRQGDVATAVVGGSRFTAPPADAQGRATAMITLPASQAPGTLPLRVEGVDVVTTTWSLSVVEGIDASYASTERVRWFDGFEPGANAWPTRSGWNVSTVADVVAQWGTDRRQAFTRADAAIAVVDARDAQAAASLTSSSIALGASGQLEVRADSHYRARGQGASGAVRVTFNTGQRLTLHTLGGANAESTQLRLPFTVPAGASTATIEFRFDAPVGAGSWMVDNVHIVEPLAQLSVHEEASAVVDVFSDVQGANDALANRVLPGFDALGSASTLVAGGDLVSTGTQANYDAYRGALQAGGASRYDTVVSVAGNHEFYGSSGYATYAQRFLANTGMADVGGQGGLWGEVLVDDELPLLWIGTEAYDYTERTGSGPFVDVSDEQFTWLQERLAHWAELDKPVLLVTHHVFDSTVSGTYARFYRDDYGNDRDRLAALLAANPNVVMLNGHTHWLSSYPDWSTQPRMDPSSPYTLTAANIGAVTTQYGPSGDWDERTISGSPPTGLRVELFGDRLRLTAYTFAADGTPTAVNDVEVAIPSGS